MKAERERETSGLVIQAETEQDNELLKYLWCNRGYMAEFSNQNGLCELVIAPEPEVGKENIIAPFGQTRCSQK